MTREENCNEEKIKFLSRLPLFSNLDSTEISEISDLFHEINLEKGIDFIMPGQPVDGLYVILDGIAGVVVRDEMVAERSVGDYLGEMGALLEEPASATVRSQSDLRLLFAPKDEFRKKVSNKTLLFLLRSIGERRKALGFRLSEALRHTPQGLIKLNQEGKITIDISDKCVKYLGAKNVYELRNKSFVELIERSNSGIRNKWSVYPMLFEETYPSTEFDMMLDLLPKSIYLPDESDSLRLFSLHYYPCLNLEKKLIAIDIGLVDITSRQKLKEIQEQERILQKIYSDPESFFDFLQLLLGVRKKLEHFMESLKVDSYCKDDLVELKRSFHTLKGTAGIFNLDEIQKLSHRAEDYLEVFFNGERGFHFAKQFITLKRGFESQQKHLEEITHQISGSLRARLKGVVFSKSKFSELKAAFKTGDMKTMCEIIGYMDSVPASELGKRFKAEAERLAASREKLLRFRLEGENTRIPKSINNELKVLIHLIRNAVDHGIESTQERIKRGKSEVGEIFFSVRKNQNSLNITVKDDGAGIDRDKLIQKALKKNMIRSPEELTDPLQLIYLSDLSTAKTVTELSGRGVGMDTVREVIITHMKGSIKTESHKGGGTCFSITIPIETCSHLNGKTEQ